LPWGGKEWSESFEDLVLLTESVAFTSLINQVVRNAFRRPRPYLYQGSSTTPLSEREDLASFFSGHAAMAFAVGIGYWRIHSIRDPGSSGNPYLLAAALVGGSAMAVSRVYSGFHFWTDVVVGSLLGSTVGFIIPELHRLDDGQAGSLTLAPAGATGLAVGIRI
jgi:membrane-associated phospholipid phosphatase